MYIGIGSYTPLTDKEGVVLQMESLRYDRYRHSERKDVQEHGKEDQYSRQREIGKKLLPPLILRPPLFDRKDGIHILYLLLIFLNHPTLFVKLHSVCVLL